jgi:PAS domain S-box-containing protein
MDGIWKMQRVSEEIESISGYPASDFVNASKRTLVSVTHPDDREAVDAQINAAIAAHQPYALEFRVIHADGGVRWVLERGVKTIDRDGAEWLDGIIFDITKRRATEELAPTTRD